MCVDGKGDSSEVATHSHTQTLRLCVCVCVGLLLSTVVDAAHVHPRLVAASLHPLRPVVTQLFNET